MANIRSKCSGLASEMVSRSVMAALFTRTSTLPNVVSAASMMTSRSGPVGEVRAHEDGSAAKVFEVCGNREPAGLIAPRDDDAGTTTFGELPDNGGAESLR